MSKAEKFEKALEEFSIDAAREYLEIENSEVKELKEFIRDILTLPGIQLNEATEWVEEFCEKHGI